MAYPSDRPVPHDEAYTYDPYYARDPNYAPAASVPPYRAERHAPYHEDRTITREVTAGPFRFGLREAILGIVALFAILGLVLGILGFAAAFALDRAAEDLNDGTAADNDADAAAAALPAALVSVLPFMAAPVLALGLGSWAGHASRNSMIGATAGAIGGFVGPIVMLLLTGMGFALGAGAASLNLADVSAPGGFGLAPGWGSTIPYLFTGAGLLWLLANTLAGGLSGGVVGGILDRKWSTRTTRRDACYTRRSLRY